MILRVALLLALSLSGCQKKPNEQARDVVTRALINTVQVPLLLADFSAKSTSFTLRQYSLNNSVQTWKSRDGVSLSFRQGVLVATRGLGDDLMSADVSNTLGMLASDPHTEYYTRFQTYLDGEYQSRFRSFQCQETGTKQEIISIFGKEHQTTRTEETCFSLSIEISNIYWRGVDGLLWKTKQWVSPSIGYLVTERLVK
jgi:hypothetical protein